MSFGVYVHIPYCLQRCTYCDFATYEQSKIMAPASYLSLLKEEMRQKLPAYRGKEVSTIYFGGGTPSLLPAEMIVELIEFLAKQGLQFSRNIEITIEINPATINAQKMEAYLNAGVNRFSVGVQTFNDPLLKSVKREHSAEQTRETLSLLKSYCVNYSADLLFALPGQSLDILRSDVAEFLQYNPNHISPYCLTVPEGHVLYKTRPLEDHQLQMFDIIHQELVQAGYCRYEISNYAKPGFESKHNMLYWIDAEYLGFGLSAHSYSPQIGDWGTRYWNQSTIGAYENQINQNLGKTFSGSTVGLSSELKEELLQHQALTDFCHTSLRLMRGLSLQAIEAKFGAKIANLVRPILSEITERGWLHNAADHYSLTEAGLPLSNQVFAQLTFLAGELPEP